MLFSQIFNHQIFSVPSCELRELCGKYFAFRITIDAISCFDLIISCDIMTYFTSLVLKRCATMNSVKIPRSFGTHDGTFHADEVTACALLLLFGLIDSDKIIRTRCMEELGRCEYVCDVGGVYDSERKLFDHHQIDYQGPMSSAGMILKYLQQRGILSDKEHDFFHYSLILGVDAHDNGKELHERGVASYSHIVSNFTPISHEAGSKQQDKAFFEALAFARGHLDRMWERYQYMQSCRQVVVDSMAEGNDYLIFDKSLPWLEIFFETGGAGHQAKFVVMPSGHHWKLRGIPPTLEEKMKVRIPMPQEWAGLLEEDLRKVSGIKGAIFCHKERFISVWETREDALKALKYVLHKTKQVA